MAEVVIVGGGIGGLTAALCLRRRGIDVEVYERAPHMREIGAGIQISPNASRLLHRLGLQEQLDEVGVRPDTFKLRRWSTDEVIVETELGAVCEERYGAPYYTFHRADLHKVLMGALPDGVVHTGHRLIEVSAEGARTRLTFEGGATVFAPTVIGADGLRSVVRRSVLPDEAKFSGQAVFSGVVPADRVPELVSEKSVTLWLGPDKHVVTYPVRGSSLQTWGMALPADEKGHESWTDAGKPDDVLATIEGWNARLRALVAATDRSLALPLYDRDPVQEVSSENITLLGDAAHPTLPFMAQGAGQAIEDGWIVADCLASGEGLIADRLTRYERLRAERVMQVQNGSRANSDLFHLPDGEQQEERDKFMPSAMSIEVFDWLYGYDAANALKETPVEGHSDV